MVLRGGDFGLSLAARRKKTKTARSGKRGEAEHIAPAEGHRQRRREQRGEHRAGIAGAGEPERNALLLRRIPIGHHRQRDGEGCARDAEREAQREHLGEAMQPELPGGEQACDHDKLHHEAGASRVPLTNQDAVDDAQQRPGEDRRRDHQAFLAGIEMQVFGDEDRQRSEQHPDGEAQIEIEETGDKSGKMTRFEKRAFHGYGSQFQRIALPDLIRMRTAISSQENWIVATAARHYATINRPGLATAPMLSPSKARANRVAPQQARKDYGGCCLCFIAIF